MRPRQEAEACQRVRHFKERKPRHRRRTTTHHGSRRPSSLGLGEEVVGVEPLTLQGDKEAIGYEVSGIGGYAAERELRGR